MPKRDYKKVKEVVRDLAQTHNMTEDEITERLIELGGIDFLVTFKIVFNDGKLQFREVVRGD